MTVAVRACVCAAVVLSAAVGGAPASRATGLHVADASSTTPRAMKKRAPPPEVEPVVIGKVRYEPLLNGKVRGLGQNGGDLVARDVATGKELYTLRVYTIRYAANMEADKQDVFISDLAADRDGRTLLVTDERGRRYRIDTQTRSVAPF